jgi:hypothetical protein
MALVWLGPGVVTIDGKKLFPGDKIIKKKFESRTWDNWVKKGKVGEPPPEPVKIGVFDDIERLKEVNAKVLKELNLEIESLRKENNALKDELKELREHQGGKNG